MEHALTEEALKARLAARGARVPEGVVITTGDDLDTLDRLGDRPVIVKALVPVTDRAGRGLVVPAAGPRSARPVVERLLNTMVDGVPVRRVLVEVVAPAGVEHYLAAGFDYLRGEPVLLAGAGGSGIERRAAPPHQWPLPLAGPPPRFPDLPEPLHPVVAALVDEFRALRAILLELNPVRLGPDGPVVLDAKAALDPALPPTPDAVPRGGQDPAERRLQELARSLPGGTEVRFGRLAGNVGMVSAGGGVLAVVHDALRRCGLAPANFADVSGGAATTELLGAVAGEVQRLAPAGILIVTGIVSSISVVRFAEAMVAALAPLRDRADGPPIVARMAGPDEAAAARILAVLPRCTTVGRDVTVDEAVQILAQQLAGTPELAGRGGQHGHPA